MCNLKEKKSREFCCVICVDDDDVVDVWLIVEEGVMRVALHQLQHLRDTLRKAWEYVCGVCY
jgi:hypothetical protein